VPRRGYRTQPRVSTLGIVHQERRALKGAPDRTSYKGSGVRWSNCSTSRLCALETVENSESSSGSVESRQSLQFLDLQTPKPFVGHERRYSGVPPGRGPHVLPDPAINRWATVICPSGTKNHPKKPLSSRHSGQTFSYDIQSGAAFRARRSWWTIPRVETLG
jgi:hypothetical protein